MSEASGQVVQSLANFNWQFKAESMVHRNCDALAIRVRGVFACPGFYSAPFIAAENGVFLLNVYSTPKDFVSGFFKRHHSDEQISRAA